MNITRVPATVEILDENSLFLSVRSFAMMRLLNAEDIEQEYVTVSVDGEVMTESAFVTDLIFSMVDKAIVCVPSPPDSEETWYVVVEHPRDSRYAHDEPMLVRQEIVKVTGTPVIDIDI